MTTHRGDWLQTYTGRKFYPQDPRPEDVDIRDIAHALSLICRYGGHCRWHYSVAQHSTYVAMECPRQHRLWGLLHDAAEAYLGDIIRPIKTDLNRVAEVRVMHAICLHFGLPVHAPDCVKTVDSRMLVTEKRDVMWNGPLWSCSAQPYENITVTRLTPEQAEEEFLLMYEEHK